MGSNPTVVTRDHKGLKNVRNDDLALRCLSTSDLRRGLTNDDLPSRILFATRTRHKRQD